MSTIREWTDEANKAIQEITTSKFNEINLLIYATAAITHSKLRPRMNTKKIGQHTPPWPKRIQMKIQELQLSSRLPAVANGKAKIQ